MENQNPTPRPAVSVIIPLYNAENYIGECLDSILNQTLTDYEVIVVDECSTDNGVEIVKSYAEKFGEKLKLTSTLKYFENDGYTARNKGLSLSKGEYVFFVDADDFIANNALEVLCTAASDFNADVVYTGSRYRYTTEGGAELTTDRIGRELKKKNIADKPTLTENDPHKNLQELLVKANLYLTPWTKFVKKNFLAENEIAFYEIISGSSFAWTIELFACAKRLLRIPNAVYYWRNDSVTITPAKYKGVKGKVLLNSLSILAIKDALSAIANKVDFLKENPEYVRLAFNLFFEDKFNRITKATVKLKPEQVYEVFRLQFKNDADLTMPFLFSILDAQEKELSAAQARIAELEAKLKGGTK